MEKSITVAVFSILALGAVQTERGDQGTPIPFPDAGRENDSPVQLSDEATTSGTSC
jgi:hypothetical protein